MLKKRGKKYYAVFSFDRREKWINTEKTDRKEALKVHARLESLFERERITRTLTGALLNCVKSLARQEITADAAKNVLASLETEAYAQALAVVEEILPSPGIAAQDVWDKYLQTAPELKASTRTTKKQRFRKFSEWYQDRDVRKITEDDCRKFLASLDTAKSQTVNNYISDLSSVWKASPHLRNPWGEHLRKRSNVEHKLPFRREEINTVIKYCEEHRLAFWRVAVILGYYTGMRLKDVVHFSRFDIRDDGYISIVPEKTERTQKRVSIPVFPQLQAELDNLVPESGTGYYFPDEVKKYAKNRAYTSKEFQMILHGASVYRRGLGFHSLRHTFVTLAKDAGIEIADIQAAVGHSSVAITEGIYYHGIRNADLTGFPSL